LQSYKKQHETDFLTYNSQFSFFFSNRFLKDGCSQTEYLSIVPLKDGKADTITTAILELLSSCNLPLQQMCAFGSDGAVVMVGKKLGLLSSLDSEFITGQQPLFGSSIGTGCGTGCERGSLPSKV
jgi:hypothetical protein